MQNLTNHVVVCHLSDLTTAVRRGLVCSDLGANRDHTMKISDGVTVTNRCTISEKTGQPSCSTLKFHSERTVTGRFTLDPAIHPSDGHGVPQPTPPQSEVSRNDWISQSACAAIPQKSRSCMTLRTRELSFPSISHVKPYAPINPSRNHQQVAIIIP